MSRSVPLPNSWITSPVEVVLVGAGGTGSQILEHLVAIHTALRGLGHPGFNVTVFDPDRVSKSNIGRQRFCAADVGCYKSDVLIHRANLFHGLDWTSKPVSIEHLSYAGDRLIIGAVDSVEARYTIATLVASTNCAWWIDCGNSQRSGHVILGGHMPGYCLPHWADLYPEVEDDPQQPSCSLAEALEHQDLPVNGMAAQIAADLIWTWFRNGQLDWHGALFTVSPPSVTPLPIRPETWVPFGYVCSSDEDHACPSGEGLCIGETEG